MARQDNSKSRITEKGTRPERSASEELRVPVDNTFNPSPIWVPALMGTMLAGGLLMILFNYLTEIDALGTPSNWYLLGGLGMILVGIIAATQYR